MGSRSRRNLAEYRAEAFKPPVFKPNDSIVNRLENRFRLFLDLQAGSCWRDLRIELGRVHGALLDVGCGAQLFRPLVPRGVRYQGIDTADAKSRFGYDVPDTQYFEGDDWPVAEESFDAVLCTEVLEHIADPEPFLTKIYRCLRPQGCLILTVPFAARWHFIPYDYRRYTPSGLTMLLQSAGFDEILIVARGNPLTVACYKAMSLQLALLFEAGQGQRHMRRMFGRAFGVLLIPVLLATAVVANFSLGSDWGEDCLGYTVSARRTSSRSLPQARCYRPGL